MIRSAFASIHESEEGHVAPAVGSLIAGAGAIILAIGAASDRGPLTIVGGIVLAVAFVGYDIAHHRTVDADLYGRIDKLNGK